MLREKIETARIEALRFIERADAALSEGPDEHIGGTKDSAALRRASMDLTRVLAAMRRSV